MKKVNSSYIFTLAIMSAIVIPSVLGQISSGPKNSCPDPPIPIYQSRSFPQNARVTVNVSIPITKWIAKI
jgi:hypothetical protein